MILQQKGVVWSIIGTRPWSSRGQHSGPQWLTMSDLASSPKPPLLALYYLLSVLRLAFLSLSLSFSPLGAFPAEYISYTPQNTELELRS